MQAGGGGEGEAGEGRESGGRQRGPTQHNQCAGQRRADEAGDAVGPPAHHVRRREFLRRPDNGGEQRRLRRSGEGDAQRCQRRQRDDDPIRCRPCHCEGDRSHADDLRDHPDDENTLRVAKVGHGAEEGTEYDARKQLDQDDRGSCRGASVPVGVDQEGHPDAQLGRATQRI